jgi:oxygen-independent coproporphyrinogen-3 oxidase
MAGIYVHVPFCSQACHYCDFHFSTSLKNVQDVIDCIKKELILQKDYLKGNTVNTIYFGGGTPSLIEPEFIFDIINVIKHNFNLEKEIECTIEVNPEDVSLNKLYNWHKCGVNRISIGIQSFIFRAIV